jgi:hypothetical protein
MYRAGWAACEAQLSHAPNGLGRLSGRGGGVIAAWSLASAATAAALAVAVTVQWRPVEVMRVADRVIEAPRQAAPIALDARLPSAAHGDASVAAQPRVKPASLPDAPIGVEGGLLSLRRQALNSTWEQPTALTVQDGGPPAAKTMRELMQEMLPSDSARTNRIWPWMSAFRGESI